jgi:hypothetical protein
MRDDVVFVVIHVLLLIEIKEEGVAFLNYMYSIKIWRQSDPTIFYLRMKDDVIIPPHNKVVRGVYWNQLVRPAVRPAGRPAVGFFLSAQ